MKNLNIGKWIILLLLVVAVILLWKWACNKPVPQMPEIKTVSDQKEIVKADEAAMKKQADSFNVILKKMDATNDKQYREYIALLNENNELLADNRVLSKPIPDTCRELNQAWIDRFGKLKIVSDQKDVAANNTINGLSNTISTQKNFIAAKDTAYKKLRANLDTCFENAKKLEQYAKKVKPKLGIYAGITAIGNPNKIYGGIGVNIGLMNRNGTLYEIGAIQMQSTTQYTVGIKTRLFKL